MWFLVIKMSHLKTDLLEKQEKKKKKVNDIILDGTATRWSSYQQLLDFVFVFLNTHIHSHEQTLMGQTGL